MDIFQDIVNDVLTDVVDDVIGNVIEDVIVDPINDVVDDIIGFNNFVNDLTSNPLGALGIEDALNSINDALNRLSGSLFGGSGLRFPDNLMSESGGNYMTFESEGSNIALFLPRSVGFQYGMNWQELDTFGALRLLIDEGPRVVDIIKRAMGGQSILSAVGDTGAVDAATGIGLNYGSQALRSISPESANYASKRLGMAPNPLKEQIFQGVNFRHFSFTFDFYPKTPSEARAVTEIIKTFKKKMHPEFKFDKYIYKYPDEFCITLYSGGNTKFMPKIKPCVLTDLAVNYAPLGSFVSMRDGSPVKTSLTLMFKELGLLTKQEIDEGY